ncbi:MAG: transcriptional repressor [Ardenticatenia bacterium]|nr:transcriptional repressor [Ardenticatenia bacterium]
MADQLADRLRQEGYRLTAPRRAVLQVLKEGEEHLSPAEVLEQGRVTYPALSRATVYRTLELLTGMGLLRPIYLGNGNGG